MLRSGYVVLWRNEVVELYRHADEPTSHLLIGDKGTLFETYDDARNAIRRTIRMRKRRWNETRLMSEYKIVRVERYGSL